MKTTVMIMWDNDFSASKIGGYSSFQVIVKIYFFYKIMYIMFDYLCKILIDLYRTYMLFYLSMRNKSSIYHHISLSLSPTTSE